MTDVFISYSRSDEKSARRLASALEGAGYSVWWDANLPAHRAYSDVIEANLRQAKAVLVLWSKNAVASQWVRAEADIARNENKLVQLTLDGTMPPLPFNQLQCTSMKGWRGNATHPGWRKIEESIAELTTGAHQSSAGTTSRWQTNRKMLVGFAVAAVLLLAAALLVPRFFGGDGERPVVAVLPFESLDNRDESLVAGMWEDTRQAISRNPQLLVLGPNTAEEIAEKGSKSAAKLADYLVEANVRSAGDRIRINANLVRTDDGSEVWSKSFDRRLDDVFALQQEIAGEIEGHIRGRLAKRGGKVPENIATSGEVYALYSDARNKIRKRQVGKYEEAYEQLQRVVQMDANFAPAWATLAVIKQFGLSGGDPASAEADARRAISLAPNLGAAHAALGAALQKGPAAQASLRRALELDPSDIEAMNWLANSYGDEAIEERLRLYSKIVEIEPLWWPAMLNRLNLLFQLNDQEAIQEELRRVDEIGDIATASIMRMEIMSRKGDLSGVAGLGLERVRSASGNERELLNLHLFPVLLQLGYFDIADKLFPPPSNFVPFIRKNDARALDLIEAQFPPKAFWNNGPLPIVSARVYLLNRQGPRLARRYREAAASPEEFMNLMHETSFPDVAPGAALALRSAGDEQQSRRLLELAEAAAMKQSLPSNDKLIRLARIHAVQGKKDQAIGELSQAIRNGWIPPYLPIHTDIALDPPLAELKSDPRFEPLRQQILRYLAKERAELGPVKLD